MNGDTCAVTRWALYNELLPEFQKCKRRVAGNFRRWRLVHEALPRDRQYTIFPCWRIFAPKKGDRSAAVWRYRSQEGGDRTGAFVLDKDGMSTWSYYSPVAGEPGSGWHFAGLEELRNRRNSCRTLQVAGATGRSRERRRKDGVYDVGMEFSIASLLARLSDRKARAKACWQAVAVLVRTFP